MIKGLEGQIGQYEFNPEQDLIGRGKHSEVYKARVHGTENSFVALKFIDEKYRARLQAEAKVLDELCDSDSQNPFPQIQGSFLDNGNPCIAMDYMPSTLKDYIKNHAGYINTKSKNFNIFKQILNALNTAHTKGKIHRDLKPENILIDKNYNIKITDFSLAEHAEEFKDELKNSLDSSKDIKFSLVGGGTIGYMAPEQEDGKPADQRTDIFVTGMILYEMLAGKRPAGKYKPLAEQGHGKWIDDLVDKCMATNPDDRFQTINQVQEYLQKGLEGKFNVKPKPVQQEKSYSGKKPFFVRSNDGFFNSEINPEALVGIPKALGKGLLKALKWGTSPIWAPHYYAWKEAIENDFAPLGIAAMLLAGFEILVPMGLYSSVKDSQFRQELIRTKLEGKIACIDENRINVFDANDITKENIPQKTIQTKFDSIEAIRFTEDGKIISLVKETIPVMTGDELNVDVKEKQVYSLHVLSPEFENGSAVIQDISTKTNGTPEKMFLSGKENIIIKNKDRHYYKINPDTGEILEDAVFTRGVVQTNIQGKYSFDKASDLPRLQIQRNSNEWGSINIPVQISDWRNTIYRKFPKPKQPEPKKIVKNPKIPNKK